MENRQSGGGRALWLFTVISLIVVSANLAHGQTISGIAGSPSQGNSLIIRGSSFGTKATPGPIKWENFNSFTSGATATTTDGNLPDWSEVSGGGPVPWDLNLPFRLPYYSPVAGRNNTLGVVFQNIDGVYNSSFKLDGNFTGGLYIDFWYRYLPANPASRNNKIWLLYGNLSGSETPQVHFAGWCDLNASMIFDIRDGNGGNDSRYIGLTENNLVGGELKHIQVWMKPSARNQSNGVTWYAVDGNRSTENFTNVKSYSTDGSWDHLRLGYYVAHEGAGNCAGAGDARSYWDDIYVDNVPTRVELGNNISYSACTHREIQIPTAWSPTEVTVTFNRGTFSPGDSAYLFVVDPNGNPSPGFPVTIGASSDLTAPASPQSLHVQ